jgi:hypothetical protein
MVNSTREERKRHAQSMRLFIKNFDLNNIMEEGDQAVAKTLSESESSRLHYGALIYLKYVEGAMVYVAYSEGFSKTTLRLRPMDHFAAKSGHLNGLFKIYPSFYNNEYVKSKQKYGECQDEIVRSEIKKRGFLAGHVRYSFVHRNEE